MSRGKLRYDAQSNFKIRKETDEHLAVIAQERGLKKGTLLRKIIETWVWSYTNGPSKDELPKFKDEGLL